MSDRRTHFVSHSREFCQIEVLALSNIGACFVSFAFSAKFYGIVSHDFGIVSHSQDIHSYDGPECAINSQQKNKESVINRSCLGRRISSFHLHVDAARCSVGDYLCQCWITRLRTWRRLVYVLQYPFLLGAFCPPRNWISGQSYLRWRRQSTVTVGNIIADDSGKRLAQRSRFASTRDEKNKWVTFQSQSMFLVWSGPNS